MMGPFFFVGFLLAWLMGYASGRLSSRRRRLRGLLCVIRETGDFIAISKDGSILMELDLPPNQPQDEERP